MKFMDYFSFIGFIDERAKREIAVLQSHGWRVRVILNYRRNAWAVRKGPENRVLIPTRLVSNPILDELFFVPLFLLVSYLPAFLKVRSKLNLLYVLNFPDAWAVPFLLLGRIFRVPTIYEIRDPWKEYIFIEMGDEARRRARFKLYYRALSFIEDFAISLSSGVIFAAQSFSEIHSTKAALKPWSVIKNYSDYSPTGAALQMATELRTSLKLTGSFVVSYVASSFWTYHGVESLIESVAIAVKQNPRIKLLLVGGQRDPENKLKKRIRELNIEDNCIVTGWIPSDQLIHYHLASDVGVIPHHRNRATELVGPIKLYNYLALGKPVIATNLKEQSRALDNGSTGILVEPNNPDALAQAILTLANDQSLLELFGKNASRVSQRSRFDEVESVYLNFISSVAH